MRVADAARWETILNTLASSHARLLDAQARLVSGRRLVAPHDDPAGVIRAMRIRRALREASAWKASGEAAERYLLAQETGLRQAMEALQQARSAAVRVATDTLTDADRVALAGILRAAERHVADAANTAVAGRYVFAGLQGARPPVEEGGPDGWLVLGVPLSSPTPDPGRARFKPGPGGNLEAPAGIAALADALRAVRRAADVASDPGATSADRSAALAGIDAAIDGLIRELAVLGGVQHMADGTRGALEERARVLERERSAVEDLDMARGAASYSLALAAYQASLAIAARTAHLSVARWQVGS